MKKILFAITIAAVIPFVSHAQGFFIKAGLGYAIPSAGQTLNINGLPYNGSASITQAAGFTSFNIKDASLASGMQMVIGACYMFNNTIGIEVDANFGVSPVTLESSNHYETSANDNVSAALRYKAKNVLIIHPALYMQTDWPKVNVYARGGLALPVSTKITIENTSVITPSAGGAPTTYNVSEEYTTSMALGFAGGMGVKFNLSDFINVWAEGSLQSASLYAKQSEYTEFLIDGQSYLSQLPANARTTQYSKSGGGNADPAFSFPFSNVGLNVGLSFTF